MLTDVFCGFCIQTLFAFNYKEKFPVNGWKVYDPVAEYKRQVKYIACQLRKSSLSIFVLRGYGVPWWLSGSSVVTVVWVRSLAQELPHTTGVAGKKKS